MEGGTRKKTFYRGKQQTLQGRKRKRKKRRPQRRAQLIKCSTTGTNKRKTREKRWIQRKKRPKERPTKL